MFSPVLIHRIWIRKRVCVCVCRPRVCVYAGSVRMVLSLRAYAVTRWLLSCGIHSQGKHALAGYFVDVWSPLERSLRLIGLLFKHARFGKCFLKKFSCPPRLPKKFANFFFSSFFLIERALRISQGQQCYEVYYPCIVLTPCPFQRWVLAECILFKIRNSWF